MDIGILTFDGVEELDFVGPFEVFSMSNEMFELAGKTAPDRIRLIAPDERLIRGAKGMGVLPDAAIAQIESLDVLVVPGGNGTRPLLKDKALLGWIARIAEGAQWTASVCTGSFLLAASGAAAGKRVTTHWAAMEEMRGRNWPVEIVSGARYVIDGGIVTAAGVSAGIDMALWLVGQLYGAKHARLTQRGMEYFPEPPYQGDD
jgi:transcriptional regulator GlxA family with amidase domain